MEDKAMLPTIVRRRNLIVPGSIDEFFNDSFLPKFFDWGSGIKTSGMPAVNVEETEKEYRIEVAAPGLEKNDLKIAVNEGVLTISSEKKTENEEKDDRYIRREFGYTSFCRSFTLPEGTNSDSISASHKNGVLNISIPKEEVKLAPLKEIKIS
jgi:HSP20 family protein